MPKGSYNNAVIFFLNHYAWLLLPARMTSCIILCCIGAAEAFYRTHSFVSTWCNVEGGQCCSLSSLTCAALFFVTEPAFFVNFFSFLDSNAAKDGCKADRSLPQTYRRNATFWCCLWRTLRSTFCSGSLSVSPPIYSAIHCIHILQLLQPCLFVLHELKKI